MAELVSILMLTHNAPKHVEISVRSVHEFTDNVDYELIIVDNFSSEETRDLVTRLHNEGLVDRLVLLDHNSLFAAGNNIAASFASPGASHYLLLNSDIEARSSDWLRRLLDNHYRGLTSYGIALDPVRVDGYCLLIDADLYRSHPLDESFQWWWSVTKQQAALLREGFRVRGWSEHESYLHHFGGMSGDAFLGAHGMETTRKEVYSWFSGFSAEVIDRLPNGDIPGRRPVSFTTRITGSLKRVARRIKRLK